MTKAIRKSEARATQPAERNPPRAAFDQTDAGALTIAMSGCFDRILKASGGASVSDGLVTQMSLLGSHGKRLDEQATDFALGFVDSMKPKDAAEALLCAQMAATHQATMMMARRLNHATSLAQQDTAERALNKLARTFAAQMDTLKRYRSKGQQTVRVERVTVENGGQAIVGDVNHRGRGEDEI